MSSVFMMMMLSFGSDDLCKEVKSVNLLISCLVSNNGALQVHKLKIDSLKSTQKYIGQSPNPELEVEASSRGSRGYSAGLAYMHTFERGGKSRQRVSSVEKQVELEELEAIALKEQLVSTVLKALYRLRQVKSEIGILSETNSSIRGVIRQYQQSTRLRPEDEMEVSVLTVALEESTLSRVSLQHEQNELETQIENLSTLDVDFTKIALPAFKRNWENLMINRLAGAEFQLAKAKVGLAKAKHKLELLKAKSDISFGPKLEFESEGSNLAIGASLSLPLNIYSANEMAISETRFNVESMSKKMAIVEENLNRELRFHHKTYAQISKAISRSVANNRIEKKHKKLHRLINRGVVSSGAVIELHRQILEYHETLNKLELKGISSLVRIKTLEGKILKEKL